MKILITGATGLVGHHLIRALYKHGHDDIRILSTQKNPKTSLPVESFYWSPEKHQIDPRALEGVDVIVNLAGENIAAKRWSEKQKDKIANSRVNALKTLLQQISKEKTPPQKFIQISAVGIYGPRQASEALDATSSKGDDFLASVCKQTEHLFESAALLHTKKHILRLGVVLASDGGALSKMLPPFRMNLGGHLGNGQQMMSWIHIEDLVRQIIFLIDNECNQVVFNAVAPKPVSNIEFTKAMAHALKKLAIFPVPALALQTLLGEMAQMLLTGQKVIPQEFIDSGFKFNFPDINSALEDLLGPLKNGEKILQRYQWVDVSLPQVFDFFSSEKNLEKITPPFLNFKVLGKNTESIQEGTLIDYQLKLYGLPMRWQSQIRNFHPNQSFIDAQVVGPYKKWDHFHGLYPTTRGTLMEDKVVYKIPMGLVGRLFASVLVSSELKKIFNYRQQTIEKIFSKEGES